MHINGAVQPSADGKPVGLVSQTIDLSTDLRAWDFDSVSAFAEVEKTGNKAKNLRTDRREFGSRLRESERGIYRRITIGRAFACIAILAVARPLFGASRVNVGGDMTIHILDLAPMNRPV